MSSVYYLMHQALDTVGAGTQGGSEALALAQLKSQASVPTYCEDKDLAPEEVPWPLGETPQLFEKLACQGREWPRGRPFQE